MHSGFVESGYNDIIDFHSHILPGVDHGSPDVSTSIAQLQLAKKYSVKRILATPHFYPNLHTTAAFLEMRDKAVSELMKARRFDLPEFKVGTEVLICDGLERFPDLDKLCFQNTKYIMLELPFFEFSESYAETAGAISDMGYKVILAHADRYPKDVIDVMLDYGVSALQINADSLTTVFKRKHIYRWMQDELVCAIGSDIHLLSKRTYSKFSHLQKHLRELILPIKASSDRIWNEIEAIK